MDDSLIRELPFSSGQSFTELSDGQTEAYADAKQGERSTKYILPWVLDSMGLFRFTQESSYGRCKSGRSCGKSSVLAGAY